MIEIIRYQQDDGNCPIGVWLQSMRDKRARAQIEIRLQRLSAGNFGQCRALRAGVMELKIDVGPGSKGIKQNEYNLQQCDLTSNGYH